METSQNIESFSFQVEDNISPPKKLFDKITLDEISQKYSNKIYAYHLKIMEIKDWFISVNTQFLKDFIKPM